MYALYPRLYRLGELIVSLLSSVLFLSNIPFRCVCLCCSPVKAEVSGEICNNTKVMDFNKATGTLSAEFNNMVSSRVDVLFVLSNRCTWTAQAVSSKILFEKLSPSLPIVEPALCNGLYYFLSSFVFGTSVFLNESLFLWFSFYHVCCFVCFFVCSRLRGSRDRTRKDLSTSWWDFYEVICLSLLIPVCCN